MKKIFSIFVAAIMLVSCLTVVTFAAPDLVHTSVEGTATIDGVKDDVYASGLALPIIQCGKTNGGGALLDAAIATAYIVNDANYVYWYIDVIDATLDNTSANNYEQDSIELFYMADNSKVQLRFHYDGVVDADTGTVPTEEEYKVVITDTGYALEYRMPITDVLANAIETCVQVNYCADGARTHTTYIEGNADGDDGYQRTNRQTDWDVWWTLNLAGEFADNRVDPEPEPMALDAKNYTTVQNIPVAAQLFAQDQVSWGWIGVGAFTSGGKYNVPLNLDWMIFGGPVFDETTTNNWTVDPKFRISISNDQFLALPADAVEGDTGDSGSFVYDYTDIVIKAEGYNDVVIPAGSVDGDLTVKMEAWGRGGDAIEIELVTAIKEQLGLDTQGLCTYLQAVTQVTTSITLSSYNLVTPDILDEYVNVTLPAEDEAVLATLQEYIDRVEAAKAVVADEAATIEDKEAAVDDASKAANRAAKDAEYYPTSTAKAEELKAAVEEMLKTIEELKAPVEEAPAEEETPADEAPADEKPAEAPASEGGSAVGIIIAIAAVVVVAVVVVIILASKKKA